jgi:hypothetical protein
MPMMHLKPSLARACALLVIAAAQGCAGTGPAAPQPPDYLQVTAIGRASSPDSALRSLRLVADAVPASLRAEGTSTLDPSIADPAQRLMMARAQARRQALQQLSERLAALPVEGGATLGGRLASNEPARTALAALLESRARVDYSESEGACRADAQLDSEAISQSLAEHQNDSQAAAPVTEAVRQAALDDALARAKTSLREQVMAIELPGGGTVGQALAQDSDARRDLEARIFILQPDEVHQLPDGSCEVRIYFDRNVAIGLAQPRGRGLFR